MGALAGDLLAPLPVASSVVDPGHTAGRRRPGSGASISAKGSVSGSAGAAIGASGGANPRRSSNVLSMMGDLQLQLSKTAPQAATPGGAAAAGAFFAATSTSAASTSTFAGGAPGGRRATRGSVLATGRSVSSSAVSVGRNVIRARDSVVLPSHNFTPASAANVRVERDPERRRTAIHIMAERLALEEVPTEAGSSRGLSTPPLSLAPALVPSPPPAHAPSPAPATFEEGGTAPQPCSDACSTGAGAGAGAGADAGAGAGASAGAGAGPRPGSTGASATGRPRTADLGLRTIINSSNPAALVRPPSPEAVEEEEDAAAGDKVLVGPFGIKYKAFTVPTSAKPSAAVAAAAVPGAAAGARAGAGASSTRAEGVGAAPGARAGGRGSVLAALAASGPGTGATPVVDAPSPTLAPAACSATARPGLSPYNPQPSQPTRPGRPGRAAAAAAAASPATPSGGTQPLPSDKQGKAGQGALAAGAALVTSGATNASAPSLFRRPRPSMGS